jgi:protein LTV1
MRIGSTTSTNLGIARRKDETPEERRERKKLAKSSKKERRVQKKSTKIQYKQEDLRQAATEVQVQKFPTGVRF